ATPSGVIELLMRSGYDPSGRDVVIVGRSNIVGKPLAALLMQKGSKPNATVTVVHSGTHELSAHTRLVETLIAATGSPRCSTAAIPPASQGGSVITGVQDVYYEVQDMKRAIVFYRMC